MVPEPSLKMNDVIVCDNFKYVCQLLDFFRHLTICLMSIFSFEGKIMELDFPNKFNNMTS